jgi:hypothetical protein
MSGKLLNESIYTGRERARVVFDDTEDLGKDVGSGRRGTSFVISVNSLYWAVIRSGTSEKTEINYTLYWSRWRSRRAASVME